MFLKLLGFFVCSSDFHSNPKDFDGETLRMGHSDDLMNQQPEWSPDAQPRTPVTVLDDFTTESVAEDEVQDLDLPTSHDAYFVLSQSTLSDDTPDDAVQIALSVMMKIDDDEPDHEGQPAGDGATEPLKESPYHDSHHPSSNAPAPSVQQGLPVPAPGGSAISLSAPVLTSSPPAVLTETPLPSSLSGPPVPSSDASQALTSSALSLPSLDQFRLTQLEAIAQALRRSDTILSVDNKEAGKEANRPDVQNMMDADMTEDDKREAHNMYMRFYRSFRNKRQEYLHCTIEGLSGFIIMSARC